MKKRIQIVILSSINVIYGCFFSHMFYLGVMLLFNVIKGTQNNPDGEMFQPIGLIILILISSLWFIVNLIIIKRCLFNKKIWVLVFLFFLVGFIIGVIYINYNHYNGYKELLEDVLFRLKYNIN